MTALCAERGCAEASIARVCRRARVSTATFYEHFTSREECLCAAHRDALGELRAAARAQLGAPGGWGDAAGASLDALLGALAADPAAARLVLLEARGAGALLQRERSRALANLDRDLGAFMDARRERGRLLDAPVAALLGGFEAITVAHLLAHGEHRLPALREPLLEWLARYAAPPGQTARWSASPASLLSAADARRLAASRARARARRVPPGRHGLPASAVRASQRERLIRAIAEVVVRKGYTEATVADIVAAAGVARQVFYEHFHDRAHAFREAQQFPVVATMQACAGAFFCDRPWGERVARVLATLARLIATEPQLARLQLLDCYAAGHSSVRRAHELVASLALFLEDGYANCDPRARPPRLYTQAVAGAIAEMLRRPLARGRPQALLRELPRLTYIALAPFTGVREAVRLASLPVPAE